MLEIKAELSESEIVEISSFFYTLQYASPWQHPLWPDDLNSVQTKMYFIHRADNRILFFAKIIESKLSNARFIKYASLMRGPWCEYPQLICEALIEIAAYYKKLNFASFSIQLDCDLQRAELIERTLRKKGCNPISNPYQEFK